MCSASPKGFSFTLWFSKSCSPLPEFPKGLFPSLPPSSLSFLFFSFFFFRLKRKMWLRMTLALSGTLSFYLQACCNMSVEPGLGTFLCFRLCFPLSVISQLCESPAQLLFPPPWSAFPSQAWRWLSLTLSIRPDCSQAKHSSLSHAVISTHCF